MKIFLDTLGCKLNQAETELLSASFSQAGHEIVDSIIDAQLYILNTCTVTQTADAKSRQLIRKVHRMNPDAIIVVTGCYAEREAESLRKIDGVRMVTGNKSKLNLLGLLAVTGMMEKGNEDHTSEFSSRTRSFVRIQDGCRQFCTYCIVPFVRKTEISVPPEEILDYVNYREASGIKEIVLTGTEVGSYRSEDLQLTDLLKRILEETSVERIRLSSLQPDEITPDLINLWKNERLCPHFHISLQSGSDAVLKNMNRRYTSEEFLKATSFLMSSIPNVAITTDVIAGFPGETDEDFEQTCEVCRKAGFARIHVFPYSKRPGTAAAKMSGQVNDGIITQRSKKLGLIAAECAESFRKKFIGSRMVVLWEQKSGRLWSGYTGNYIRVYVNSDNDVKNCISTVTLAGVFKDGMRGKIS
jgi:threonylcarbamoyladenosine tRNA methylthiotransferase MtaB